MAGLRFSLTIAPTATGTSKQTMVQLLAPTNQRVKVKGWSFSFDGTSNTAVPITCTVEKQTTAGGGSPTSLTPVKLDPDWHETIQSTAIQNQNNSTQPTLGAIERQQKVHPQGAWEELLPAGEEILVPGGTRLGFTCTAASGVNAIVEVICEE